MKKVSVLMSFYNEEVEYFLIAANSILSQTYKNFEFILIGDNPDNIALNKAAEQLSKQDERILFIRNDVNLGLTKSLNRGLKLCKGEYVVRMDADDYSYPDRIAKQVEYMDSNPLIVASGCYANMINEKGTVIGKMYNYRDSKDMKALLPFKTPIFHPSAIIRRIINGKTVSYDENFRYSQDYALWFTLIDFGISNIPEFLICYRISKKQISATYKQTIKQNDYLLRKQALKKYYNNINEQDCDILINLYYKNTTKKQRKQIIKTIQNVQLNNRTNSEINVNVAARYLYSIYCEYLANNYNYFQTFVLGMALSLKLRTMDVRILLSILKEKYIKNV